MSGPIIHPDSQALFDFVNGKLEAQECNVIELHIAHCKHCVTNLEHLASDRLGERIRSINTQYSNLSLNAKDNDRIPTYLVDHPRYEFIEKIGSGGMGDVFAGRQRSMDRAVALKILKSHLFRNERAVARFRNEIKVAAKLNHPNIVHSYDAEVSNGVCLLVMELVRGQKLSEIVETRQQLSIGEACHFVREIAIGLQYAHQKGMIHRDVKPQNVLVLENGAVKITDFGLAKFAMSKSEADGSLTLDGETFGTPDYISPEQIRDAANADNSSDIYSLGCTFYFLLSGRTPFTQSSVEEKLAGHLEKQPDPIESMRPDLPAAIVSLIQSMMAKSSSDRPADLSSVIDQLKIWAEHPVGSKHPQLRTGVRSRPTITAATSLIETNSPATVTSNSNAEITRPSSVGPTRAIGGFDRRIRLGLCVAALAALGLGIFEFVSGPVKPVRLRFAIIIPMQDIVEEEVANIQQAIATYKHLDVDWISNRVGRVQFGAFDTKISAAPIEISKTIDEIRADEYDAFIFSGCYDPHADNPFHANEIANHKELNQAAQRLSKQMMDDGKMVTAVCGGITVLGNAGLLAGKRVANSPYFPDSYRQTAQVKTWIPETLQNDGQCVVVVDGLIVTAGNKRNIEELFEIIVKKVSRTKGVAGG